MKKLNIKKIHQNIFYFIIGAIIFTPCCIYAAYLYHAKNMQYTPNDTTWKVNNINEALDDLYDLANTKQSTPSSSFTQVYSASNLTTYSYVVEEGVTQVLLSATAVSAATSNASVNAGYPKITITGYDELAQTIYSYQARKNVNISGQAIYGSGSITAYVYVLKVTPGNTINIATVKPSQVVINKI